MDFHDVLKAPEAGGCTEATESTQYVQNTVKLVHYKYSCVIVELIIFQMLIR